MDSQPNMDLGIDPNARDIKSSEFLSKTDLLEGNTKIFSPGLLSTTPMCGEGPLEWQSRRTAHSSCRKTLTEQSGGFHTENRLSPSLAHHDNVPAWPRENSVR